MSLHSHPSVSDESQKSDLTDLHDVLEDAWRGCFSGILEFWGLGQQGTDDQYSDENTWREKGKFLRGSSTCNGSSFSELN